MSEKEPEIDNTEMSFTEHLQDLRKRIMYAVLGLVAGIIIAFVFIEELMNGVLLAPALKANLDLQNLKVFGKVLVYFKVATLVGIVFSFPFLLYQIWKFVEPALYSNEKNWARKITFFTSLCFFGGVTFAYYVMIPPMLQFSVSFGMEDNIKTVVDINEYWSFILLMILAAGIFFELPMVSYVLSRVGMLTPRFMRKYRRHAIVVILIVAAIITPTPDPFNQMIVAVPIYILYEISIFIAHIGMKQYFEPKEASLD